ncbi:MAG: hypothetical protein Kow0031_06810 [Anaerolineae bacterium]
MENLLSTKQLQELLNIDRTTVYRMLKDGRLNGIKVGNQWRFPREEVDAILTGGHSAAKEAVASARSAPAKPAAKINPLPLNCIQAMHDVFAEVLGIGAIATDPAGEPLSKMSNPCQFCRLILDSASGKQACIESWQKLAQRDSRQTDFERCHAGLLYARSRITLNGQFKAMLIVGQFYNSPPAPAEETDRVAKLAHRHNINEADLLAAAKSLPVLNQHTQDHIMDWLSKEVRTIEAIGNERLQLLNLLGSGAGRGGTR